MVVVPAPAPDPGAVFTTRRGVVASFDDHEGSGTVADAGSSAAWSFHCTRIADGSRTVAVGTVVTYRIEPGPYGFEAVAIAPTV
jgi:cold shock CspA family protein